MSPFTTWDDVPLVCSKQQAAAVLNISVRSIESRLADGTMAPAPMPRTKGGKEAWKWSKSVLKTYVEGGYARRGR